MKKILYILPLALITLVSCQKEEMFSGKDNAVRINATIGEGIPLSRTNPTENPATSWSNGDQIAVNNDGNAYVTYTYNGTSWATASSEFLKWSTPTMTFNGYHPVTEGTSQSNFTLPTDQSDLSKIAAADYMTVSESKTKPESGYGVDLNFARKTARVIIKITKFNSGFTGTPVISNLTITSAHTGYVNGTVNGNSTAVTAYKVAGEDTYMALVIPEGTVLMEDYINLDVTDDNGTQSLKLSNINATEAGKSYTHNLTVGKNRIEVNSVTVEDWGLTGTLPDGDVGIQAGSVVIKDMEAGQIIFELGNYTNADITSLSISGALNAYDFGIIRLNLPNLEILDLSQTTITEVPDHALNYYTGEGALGNFKLRRIILPPTVKTVGIASFQYCKALTSISLDGVETIGGSAFFGCSALSSVDLNGVKTIGEKVFNGCSALSSVDLGDNLETVNNSVFFNCTSLRSIEFLASVRTLGRWMFEQCQSLTTITLPEGIEDIPASAFWGTLGLKSINIPASVKTIGNYAFAGCASLENITIPETVMSLGAYMFENCHALKSATVLADVTELPASIFNGCGALTTCTLNDKIQVIAEQAFATCSKLSNINMPNSLTTIGTNAFSNTALKTLTLPEGVSNIGESAFYNSEIKTLKINSTVDLTIGHRAFFFCDITEVMTITLPASLKSISCTSFHGNGILQITCHAVTPPEIITNDPDITPNPTSWTAYTGCYLKVPAGSVDAYSAISFWNNSFPGESLTAIE